MGYDPFKWVTTSGNTSTALDEYSQPTACQECQENWRCVLLTRKILDRSELGTSLEISCLIPAFYWQISFQTRRSVEMCDFEAWIQGILGGFPYNHHYYIIYCSTCMMYVWIPSWTKKTSPPSPIQEKIHPSSPQLPNSAKYSKVSGEGKPGKESPVFSVENPTCCVKR